MLSRLQQRIVVGINALGNAVIARFSAAPDLGSLVPPAGAMISLYAGVVLAQQNQQEAKPQPRLARSIKNELAIKSEEIAAKKHCSGGAKSLFWTTAKELAKNVPVAQLAELKLPDEIMSAVKSASVFIK